MKRKCPFGGTVFDDSYHSWKYPDGMEVVKCDCCNARRKLKVVNYSVARRQIRMQKVIFPYHGQVS